MTQLAKRINEATGSMRRFTDAMNRAKRMEHLYRRSKHFALPWPVRRWAALQLWWMQRDAGPWLLPLLIGIPIGIVIALVFL